MRVNIWCGVISNFVIGPFELPSNLTGPRYLNFLQHHLNRLLEDHRKFKNKCNVIRNNQRLLERVDFNFRRRINLCLRENGDHFEQLL
ncbi:hypothetical protein NQ318_022626 [Aromia moschata]|uniref:Uncharacterized protein n=1 Tax=Aromia moschata TaxID=1265417 RepID=A0AAV8YMN9_9CUCU|nr:hypothetical protein NQ318_022626 [Aromia moschata]